MINRFIRQNGSACLLSVDGTDFRIYEPVPFWGGWRSFKFRAAGLRYEIAICIQTGWIVWVNGPFPAGRWVDITIFRYGLKKLLLPRERVEADLGYRGDPKVDTPIDHCPNLAQSTIKSLVRGRHETVNKRMKQFGCLQQRFRHNIGLHGDCFNAVAVITQLNIQYGGEPLYSVPYFTL